MPNLFNLYEAIMNIDIGTIVVYTCKNNCPSKTSLIEEQVFIQRTGEKLVNLDKDITEFYSNKGKTNVKAPTEQVLVKGNTNNIPDDDGFIEVKKKKKK